MQALRTMWPSAVLFWALAVPAAAADSGLVWEPNLESAKQAAARSNRLILVHFGAPWCSPCQRLEQEVFNRPGFGKELAPAYVGVKLNIDHYPATARQYGVQTVPTDVILTPQGQLVERLQSPLTGADFVEAMQRIAVAARSGRAPNVQNASLRGAPPNAAAAVAPASAPASAPAAAPAAPQTADRYADYYNRRRAEQQAQTAAPYTQGAVPAAAGSFPQSAAPRSDMPPLQPATVTPPAATASQPPAHAAPAAAQSGALQPAAAAPQHAAIPAPGVPQIPPGNAPLGLDGYCPVTLCERQVWLTGDTRWGMQHRGRTYLFAGPVEQQKFRANPDRYSPVISGNDPVIELDLGQSVPGSRAHGVFYGERIYLFSGEGSLQQFMQNPNRYTAEAVQARR